MYLLSLNMTHSFKDNSLHKQLRVKSEGCTVLNKADLVILVSAFPSNMPLNPSPLRITALKFGILRWSDSSLEDCHKI